MRELGTASWRFEESEGSLLHLALRVRDACALPGADGPAVPPPLVDAPPSCGVLGDPERRAAGRQWAGWWAALLDFQVRSTERMAADGEPVGIRFLAELDALGAPPDFAGLGDRPELRRAAVAVAADPGNRRGPAAPEGAFGYELVRQVAEDVAFDRTVSPDRVTGAAVVLDVQGLWWHALAPGVVLCSRAAARDPRTAHGVLRQAFESGLRP